MDRSDNDWAAVRWNIWKARQIWGRLGKLLRQEGDNPIILVEFYCALVQAVLIFGAET